VIKKVRKKRKKQGRKITRASEKVPKMHLIISQTPPFGGETNHAHLHNEWQSEERAGKQNQKHHQTEYDRFDVRPGKKGPIPLKDRDG